MSDGRTRLLFGRELVRIGLRGAPALRFDARLWLTRSDFGLAELLSEDFEHGRRCGTVETVDPFAS